MSYSESSRLSALYALGVLDTEAEARFDRITDLAADLFDVPIALLSLADHDRQWFKSHHGLCDRQTPRSGAFCDLVIQQTTTDVLIVENAAADPRFADNPLVTGAPFVRFYAGAVLRSPSGHNVGSLCVIDAKPRPRPSDRDLARLRTLADMAERELAMSAQLHEAEESVSLLDMAEEMSGVSHWRFNFEQATFIGSRQAYQMHGYQRGEQAPTMANLLACYDPGQQGEIVARMMGAKETGQGYELMTRVILPDGRLRHVAVKTTCTFAGDGTVASLIGVIQDQTDALDTQRRISESEALVRLLADNTSDVATFVTPDGRLTYLSSGCERMTGYVPDEIVGRMATRLIHPDHWQSVAEAFLGTLAGEAGQRVEYRLIRKDGEVIWIEARPTLVRDPQTGRVLGVSDSMRDITDRKRAAAELAASERRYGALFESLATGVVVQDQTGAIIEANVSAAHVLGLTRDQLLGRSSIDPRWKAQRDDGSDFPGEEHPAMVTLKTGRPVRDQVMRLNTPDGEPRWIKVSADPRFENGDVLPYQVVCTFEDVSEIRLAQQAQDQLIQALEQSRADMATAMETAELANQAKSAFLANMSHELRTPLNGVLGVAGVLSSADLGPREQEMVALITDSARSLEAILSDILDWSKAEAGKLAIEKAPFRPDQSLSALIDLMRIRAREKGLDFQVNQSGPVDLTYDGDPLRIKQVVANLLSNAIKFTDRGRVEIDIALDSGGDPAVANMLEITVRDTGVGFDQDTRNRLFDRFEQADVSFTRKYGGTGLGLPISLALTQLMGGVLLADSTPGMGSTFSVRLPLMRTAEVAQPASDPDRQPLATTLRVLLAEDHPTNQKVVAMILEPMGVSLTIVDDGAKAVDAVAASAFDLIIMDMQMPVMDGLEAIRRIRADERVRGLGRTPIAVLSANAAEEHRQLSALAGADAHISKPVSPHSLVSGIERAFDAASDVPPVQIAV